jgi:hypothetical protein
MTPSPLCAVECYKYQGKYYLHILILLNYLSFKGYAIDQNCIFDNEYTCSKYSDEFYNLYLLNGKYTRDSLLSYIKDNYTNSLHLFTDNIFRELESELQIVLEISLD